MKAFYLTFALLFVFVDSHAGGCYLPDANNESTKKFLDRVEVVAEQTAKDIELVFTIPSELEGHEFKAVALVIVNKSSDDYELLVPVASDKSLDGKSNKIALLLPLDLFEKAELTLTYGLCALRYRLKLSELSDRSQVPKQN
ncbi:MAG: hypothetical protein WBN06_03170 [Lysobacterales bacterium]